MTAENISTNSDVNGIRYRRTIDALWCCTKCKSWTPAMLLVASGHLAKKINNLLHLSSLFLTPSPFFIFVRLLLIRLQIGDECMTIFQCYRFGRYDKLRVSKSWHGCCIIFWRRFRQIVFYGTDDECRPVRSRCGIWFFLPRYNFISQTKPSPFVCSMVRCRTLSRQKPPSEPSTRTYTPMRNRPMMLEYVSILRIYLSWPLMVLI